MITAYGDDATIKRATELGAAGLLAKPIDFGLLRAEPAFGRDGVGFLLANPLRTSQWNGLGTS